MQRKSIVVFSLHKFIVRMGLVGDDGLGGEVGEDDDLDAFVDGTAGTAGEVVASHLDNVGRGVGVVGVDVSNCRGAAFCIVDSLQGGAAGKSVIADVADGLWENDLAQIGGTLESASCYAATVGVDGVGDVATAGGIAHQDPVLGAFVANGIEYAVDGLVLVDVVAIDVARRELVNLLNLLCVEGGAHGECQQDGNGFLHMMVGLRLMS